MLWELQSICLEALAIAKEYENRYQRPLSATAEMYSLLARVYVEWGENEKAIQFARQGLSLSERWGLVNIEALCLSHLGRVLILSNDWEQARQVFLRADIAAKKVSTWYYQLARIFALDSMLDCEAPESDELIAQVHHLQENGASIPPALSTRLLIREGHPEAALTMLEGAIKDLEGQLSVDLVRLHGLRSLAYQVQGDEKQALASLQVALKVGEPDNRIASFVREGAAMEKLLRLAQASGIYPTFVRRLLAAFEARRKPKQAPVVTDMLIEPLSNRELQVLQLLAQGCSDKVIAETLVIARDTVHKYLGNIYSKLDVHSRMEAILRARELGML
jgi:LuxR family maltose regulon positive regulatory protein